MPESVDNLRTLYSQGDINRILTDRLADLDRRMRLQEAQEQRTTFNRDMLGPVEYEHFRSGAIPSGYAWAGAPFGTPANIAYSDKSDYGVFYDGTNVGFLQKSITAYLGRSIWARLAPGEGGSAGLRFDDGTDNNYSEAYIYSLANAKARARFRYRQGGGAVTTVDAVDVVSGQFYGLRLLCSQTGANHWEFAYILTENGYNSSPISNSPAAAWTVSRVGILTNRDALGGRCMFDWFFTNAT